jgi:hypothetical protein
MLPAFREAVAYGAQERLFGVGNFDFENYRLLFLAKICRCRISLIIIL